MWRSMWTAPASVDSGWSGGLLFFFLFHFLVVDRGQVVERGVQPASVVEGLDGVEDGGARLGACAERAATEEVLGRRGEEALGDGVVVGGGAIRSRCRCRRRGSSR